MEYAKPRKGGQLIRYGTVGKDFSVTPRPPEDPGVYLFLGEEDRVMYVGMAHNLEAVLYRYKGLEGRQRMRARRAAGAFTRVAWLSVTSGEAVASLERVAISHFEPPWNDQHNPRARTPGSAIPFDGRQSEWLTGAERALSRVVADLV